MRRQMLTVLALAGAAVFAPSPWDNNACAQVILSTTGTTSTSHPQNPRGAAYFANAHPVDLVAGTSYTITCLATAQPVPPFPQDDTYLYLLSPSGALLTQDDDSYSTVRQWSAKIPSSGTGWTAPASGRYTIICTTWAAGYVMPYQLTVTQIAGATQPAILPGNILQIPDALLSTSHPQNPRGPNYNANAHPVTLIAGGQYTIQMRPWVVGDDSYLYLLDPNGRLVTQDDDGDMAAQVWASKIVYTPTVTGTFTIIATSYGAGRSFRYQIAVNGPPAQTAPPTTNGIPNVQLQPRSLPTGVRHLALGDSSPRELVMSASPSNYQLRILTRSVHRLG